MVRLIKKIDFPSDLRKFNKENLKHLPQKTDLFWRYLKPCWWMETKVNGNSIQHPSESKTLDMSEKLSRISR